MATYDQSRRNQIARARGFKSFNQYRETNTALPLRGAGTEQLGDHQEYVTTRDEGKLRAAVRRAARNEMKLNARVTMLLDPAHDPGAPEGATRHPKTWRRHDVEIWAKGDYDAGLANELVELTDHRLAFAMIAEQVAAIEKYPGCVLTVLLRVVA